MDSDEPVWSMDPLWSIEPVELLQLLETWRKELTRMDCSMPACSPLIAPGWPAEGVAFPVIATVCPT